MPAPQIMHVPFGLGLGQETGDFVKPVGKLWQATNAHINYDGTLETRKGFEALSTTEFPNTVATPNFRLFSRGDELCASDGQYLYTRLEHETKWERVDTLPEVNITGRYPALRGPGAPQFQGEVVYCNGVYVCAWIWGAYICTVCIDAVTGARYNETTWSGSGQDDTVRLAKLGTKVYAFTAYVNVGGVSSIVARVLDTSSTASGWSAWATIATDAKVAGPLFEVTEGGTTANDHLYLVYDGIGAMASNGRLLRITSALAVTHNVDLPLAEASLAWGIAADETGNHVWAFCAGTAGGLHSVYCKAADLSSLSALTNIDATAGAAARIAAATSTSLGYCVVTYDIRYDSLTGVPQELRALKVSTTPAVTGYHRTYHMTPATEPWYYSGRWFCLYYFPEKSWQSVHAQPNNYVCEMRFDASAFGATDSQPITHCRIAMQRSGELSFRRYSRATRTGTTGEYAFAVPKLSETQTDLNSHLQDEGFDVYTVKHRDTTCQLPVRVGPYVALSGGVPTMYDGKRAFEIGFNYYPRCNGEYAAGGHFTAGRVYQWRAVYRWVDAQGARHVSAPSEALEHTFVGADLTMNITVDCLTLTNMGSYGDAHGGPVQIDLYRTIYDTAGSAPSTQFYLVESKTNLDRSASVTFTDDYTEDDTELADNETLYTAGGVLDNDVPPASLHLAVHNNRVWTINADTPYEVWYSKGLLPYEGPAFSRAFLVTNTQSEKYNAIASAGSNLFAFRDDQIDVVTGMGPNDLGTGASYEDPVLVVAGIGCTDARACVEYPGAIAFNSRGRIYSVSNGGQARWIGAAARGYIEDSYPVIRGACLDASRRRLVFPITGLDDTAADNGRVLCYYYDADQWVDWHIVSSTGGALVAVSSASVVSVSGTPKLHLMSSAGVVYRERATCLKADSTAVVLGIRTGWISPSGMQGWGRVWRVMLLGKYLSAHSADVRCYNDYRNTSASLHSFTSADVAAGTSSGRVQLEIVPTTQEAQSMSFGIELTPITPAFGACQRLESLAIEFAPDGGLHRAPSTVRK